MAPSTFASAAAGNSSNTTNHRQDGSGEWPRRTNGATQTFRRPSLATSYSNSNHNRDNSLESTPARYVPPHRNGVGADTRYSKEQLLEMFRTQEEGDSRSRDSLTSLFVGGWEPDQTNGATESTPSWPGRENHREGGQSGSDAFWDNEGSMIPLGLIEMTEAEKETFTTSVNSPIKPVNASSRETPGRDGLPLRKISVSHNPNSPGAFAMHSPSTARTGRRREASESYPFPTNPLASPKPRDDHRTTSPPPALRRRTTDLKDPNIDQRTNAPDTPGTGPSGDFIKQSMNSSSRNAGGPTSAGLNRPSSPWTAVQPSPGFAPMGSFGNFSSGGNANNGPEKRPGLGSGRAESRFKGLMSKDSTDDIHKTLREKSSLSGLGKAADSASRRSGWSEVPRQNSDENEGIAGSAALGGGEETSHPPLRGLQDRGTPHRPDRREEFGFSAWTPENGLRGLSQDQQPTSQQRGPQGAAETMSPTNTNPYRSPQQGHVETDDLDTDDSDLQNVNIAGLSGLVNDDLGPMNNQFGGFSAFSQAPGDRGTTTSAGPNRGFGGLSGLGALPGLSASSGWGTLPPTIATPGRGGFGDNVFGSVADIQSPSLAGLGPSNVFGAGQGAVPGAGRGISRMGSLFQQSGQDSLRSAEAPRISGDEQPSSQAPPGMPHGDEAETRAPGQSSESRQSLDLQPGSLTQGQHQPSASTNNQPPTAQQKTMVMPDRMRWIYRDPQGNTQGPWTGLEMHDWYKAGFFSPELLVKKAEDPDYEPLAQLIRRIGNSREPFLVPQIGIPHGIPAPTWAQAPLGTGSGQPPFAASFPSFGTTLTAEQQNALERRKQEEQYLMARQKEHLAQQQMAQRLQLTGQHNLLPQQLQHHPSVQSLHSQPSFGSVAAVPAFPNQTPGQPAPVAFDGQLGLPGRGFGAVGAGVNPVGGLGALREEELPSGLSNLNISRPLESFGAPGQAFPQHPQVAQIEQNAHQQQVNQMLEDRARLQQEQAQQEATHRLQHEQHFDQARLDEFNQIQMQNQLEHQQTQHLQEEAQRSIDMDQKEALAQAQQTSEKEPRSLTEQVQQAVSAKESPASASPWAQVDPLLPQPFPPAPSQSPLPAPAAQRNRSHVADALHAESHSRSQSPSVETPTASLAPWAKEPAEPAKGPSLKEIQEAEAKNAAKAEALAAEARRQAMEREALSLQATAAAAANASTVGLPSSSTWASAGAASPSTPSSAWAKTPAKPVAGPAGAKSMAQIQKEEEARKKRLAAAAAQAQQNAILAGNAAHVQGKRYAELASKISAAPQSPSAQTPTGAWTTVGASGKVKPTGGPPTAPVRSVSATATTPLASAAPGAVKKPTVSRATTTSGAANAHDEFKRWAASELRNDLTKGLAAEDFVNNLLAFPPEVDIITEAVHSVSNTIDSRHFAEEFLRRRKLADRGVFDVGGVGKSAASPADGDGNKNGGGWSEVAKKGKEGAKDKDELAGNFKVVAAKKKAKR